MKPLSDKLYANSGNIPLLRTLRETPAGTALDCGCGSGDNARILCEKGWIVDGITLSDSERVLAGKVCRKVVIADLESDLIPSLKTTYDLLIFSHVLEHLREPQRVLEMARRVLKPRGLVVVALPNLLFYPSRSQLCFGRFEYMESGLMDETHLRWYTFATGRRLLESAGYSVLSASVEGIFPLWRLRDILPVSVCNLLNDVSGRCFPGLFGRQLIYLAQR